MAGYAQVGMLEELTPEETFAQMKYVFVSELHSCTDSLL